MPIRPGLPGNRLPLLLVFALACLAPAAGAQSLAPVVGESVPYRISVPEGWPTSSNGGVLLVSDPDEESVIVMTVLDLAAPGTRPPSMSEAEARRILTDRAMSSDSVLLQLLHRNSVRSSPRPLTDITLEMGTLGGERAGWLSARTRTSGGEAWVRACLTVVDGIVYTLVFMGQGEPRPEQESLVARIGESFVPADPQGEPGSRR